MLFSHAAVLGVVLPYTVLQTSFVFTSLSAPCYCVSLDLGIAWVWKSGVRGIDGIPDDKPHYIHTTRNWGIKAFPIPRRDFSTVKLESWLPVCTSFQKCCC